MRGKRYMKEMISTAGAFLVLVATILGDHVKACEFPRREFLAFKAFHARAIHLQNCAVFHILEYCAIRASTIDS
jgi:hypothetical protein